MLLSLVCLLFMGGLVVAAQYTIASYDKDKKVVHLKDADGKEVTGKLTDSTKVWMNKKGEKAEGKMENLEKMLSSDKSVGRKVEATIKDGEVSEITVGGGKK
jgi:hypothetical protein